MISEMLYKVTILMMLCLVLVKTDRHEETGVDQQDTKFVNLLYGSTVNMTCADNDFHPQDFEGARYQWVLPTAEILTPHDVDSSNGHYRLQKNGSILTVSDIERPDFGIYYCLVMMESDFSIYTAIRWGINVDGPYFGDLSGKYMPRMKNGLFAGVVVFLVMSMFCYNYDSFQARQDTEGKPARADMEISMQPYLQSGKTRSDMEMTYINAAYVTDQMSPKGDDAGTGGDEENESDKTTQPEGETKTAL